MEKLGHMLPIDACFFDLNAILNHSNISKQLRGRHAGSLLKPLIFLRDRTRARVTTATREEGDTQGKVHKHSSIYPWEKLEVYYSG